jgi:hypothetical protein
MLHFITGEYHGCEQQHLQKFSYNQIVNLALVETIVKEEDATSIKFVFQKNEPILWKFINDAIRDLEYARIMEVVQEKQDSSVF